MQIKELSKQLKQWNLTMSVHRHPGTGRPHFRIVDLKGDTRIEGDVDTIIKHLERRFRQTMVH